MKPVLVFGSINLDVSLRVPRLPAAGETLAGEGLLLTPGGKGANQAHAARRFGAAVRLVGAVGGDALAEPALALLRAAGVDLQGVQRLPGQATGVATVHVDRDGENAIVVAAGANAALGADAVSDEQLRDSAVLLLQGEVPLAESLALARRARVLGVPVILNAAPVGDASALHQGDLDFLIVNRGELQALAGQRGLPRASDDATAMALVQALVASVVVTRGAEGSTLYQAGAAPRHQSAYTVPVRDTTGAGDTWCGVLAAVLAEGRPLIDALRCASAAAALACTAPGAQAAQPGREAVLALLSGT